MPTPEAPVLDYARRDLVRAVEVAFARDGRLLAAGEAVVLRRFLTLSPPAGSLFARLLGRRPAVFPLDGLAYAEVPDVDRAVGELVSQDLAWRADRVAPRAWLAQACTVDALKAACRALGLPAQGRRADLLARLDRPDARPLLARPSVLLRHRGLFRRLCRMYLHDHEGDLSRLVVARLGHVHYPAYQPTGGVGLWRRRRDLLDYEAGLARVARLEADPSGLEGELPRAVAAVEAAGPLDPVRVRFSGRRFDEAIALAASRDLERAGRHEEARAAYSRLLAAGLRRQGAAALRHALTLEALGQPAAGARACLEAREDASPTDALALDRTGARLARRAGLPWTRLPPLARAPQRTLVLEVGQRVGARPGWLAGERSAPVESAVVDRLAAHGRVAVHGENGPWTTLFGLLFRDVLFSPVEGMLPTPLLAGPLDLDTPVFYPRRRAAIDARLEAIAAGGAPEILAPVLESHEGEAIAGVRWDLFATEDLLALVASVDGPALAALLAPFARGWRHARRGMPDLCLLPGPAAEVEGLDPPALPPGLLLVEVKGPRDTLRDDQRVWLDRLQAAGVGAEVWLVAAAGQVRPDR